MRPLAIVAFALLAIAGGGAGCGSDDGGDGGPGTGPDGPGACTTPGGCTDGPIDPAMVQCPAMPEPLPVTTHPRLFLTSADIPRLRSWAVDSNPIWKDGLKELSAKARQTMDAGPIPKEDTGPAYSYTPYPVESYAE